MAIEVEHVVGDAGDDFAEEWSRVVAGNDDVLGVFAGRWQDGGWQMFIAVLEFIRRDPLESEFRAAMQQALNAVPGVAEAYADDREIYEVTGTPSGEALVRAAAAVIDQFADRLQAAYDDPS